MLALLLLAFLASGLVFSLSVQQTQAKSAYSLNFIGEGEQIAGMPFTISVKALKQNGNVQSSYDGTVIFTSSDTSAVLPEPYTYIASGNPKDNGIHTFTFTLNTPGTQTITVTDNYEKSATIEVIVKSPITVLPEYPVGGLLVFVFCFGAFAIFVKRQKTQSK